MIRTNKSIALARAGDGGDTIVGKNVSQETAARRVPPGVSSAQANEELGYSGFGAAAPGMGLPTNSQVSNITVPGIMLPLLDGFMSDHPVVTNRLYRECYYHDPVVGSAIDLLSTFPFGDFNLSGVSDESKLKKFASSVEALRFRTLMPQLSHDFLVLGKFIALLGWNDRKRYFDSIAVQNIDYCTIEPSLVSGIDPLIRFSIPKDLQNILADKRPEVQRIVKEFPTDIRNALGAKGGEIILDRDRTIYVARQASPSDVVGTSLLKRILPIWLMEKALIRGTLDSVWKRQRPLMHIAVGDDMWEPTMSDMQETMGLFQAADHDPAGAFVITRQAVNVNEFRRGDDFFKYNDFYDFAMRAKMQALGIAESFLTGDATMSAAQGVISVTMQYFAAYRNKMTRALFYDKVFPAIAVANRWTKKDAGSIVLGSTDPDKYMNELAKDFFTGGIRNSLEHGPVAEFASNAPSDLYNQDLNNYVMPKVQWHDSLKPDTTTEFQELLARLTEHGVPVPLRMWASSAGVSLDHIVEQMKGDIEIRKKIQPWIKSISKNIQAMAAAQSGEAAAASGQIGGGDDDNGDDSNSPEVSHLIPGQGSVPRVGLLQRDFSGVPSVYVEDSKGRLRAPSKRREAELNDKINKLVAEAAAGLAQEQKARANAEYDRRRTYSYATKAAKAKRRSQ